MMSSRGLALIVSALDPDADDADPGALDAALTTRMHQLAPDVEPITASFRPRAAGDDTGRTVLATDLGALAAAALAADVVVVGPAELGRGVPGEALVGREARGLAFATGVAVVAAVTERPLWLVGVRITRPTETRAAELLRALLELSTCVTLADTTSRDAIADLGVDDSIVLDDAADVSLRWSPSSPERRSPPTVALVDELRPHVFAELWRSRAEADAELSRRSRAIEERDRIIRRREEQIAELRREAAALDRPGMAALELELAEIKSSRAWRTLSTYRLARARVRAFRQGRPWHPPPRPLPLPETETTVPARPSSTKHDVVCFSIIDWSIRRQRPQQLALAFAARGHRVFYIRPSNFLAPGGAPFAIEELSDNVFAVTVATRVHPLIREAPIDASVATEVADSIAALRTTFSIYTAIAFVQLPTWNRVAQLAREKFGWPIVYDCMDEWRDFPGIASAIADEEPELVRSADLLIVSAQRLADKWADTARSKTLLARNATDFEHFARATGSAEELSAIDGPVVGYIGTLSDWFDVALVAWLARQRPQCTFVHVGPVEVDVGRLRSLKNVKLLGQREYTELPEYLARFDVCMIPFLVNETTAATDPVKFYEYVSQGKPVVATWMPELEPYRDHVSMAHDRDEFLELLDRALVDRDGARREQRVALARANDWRSRYEAIESRVVELFPMVSMVVVSYDNAALTLQCVESILRNTTHPRFEVIVIDNASSDDSVERLRALAASDRRVSVHANDTNRGFAAAVNQGLTLATGDVLVIMNNDIVLPNTWQSALLRQAAQPDVGLVVATTNASGNESRIAVSYTTLQEMETFAAERQMQFDGRAFDIRVAAMYCVAMRRDVFEAVGPLDESFGMGLFEDDDYSHRVRLAGFRVVCAEAAFVHHAGQAAFSRIAPEDLQRLWDENQRHFEDKWGVSWEPHTLRADLAEAVLDEQST